MQCHFLAQVKRNCRKLWETIALYTALHTPISTCEYYEQRGVQDEIYRRIELYQAPEQMPKGWNGIQRLVKVRRWGVRKGKAFEQLSFYALSKPMNSALLVARAIQGHWAIENQLHWVKDVNMGEDHMTLKNKNAVALVVHLNNTAINSLRNAGYKPTKDTFAKFANKVNELITLFQFNT